jgi:rare lipoprotein A (peptidoglycan hydrolase)
LTYWGVITALVAMTGATVATMTGASVSASADEASVSAALSRHNLSSVVGMSSYYGAEFHGRRTADGEIFDMHGLTAAHKTLPIPCYARVTNLTNGRSVVVRVNDRGPYIGGRVLDVSERVAKLLSFHGGLARIKLDFLGMAGPAGADDQRALLASLKGAGEPAKSDSGLSVAERAATALAKVSPALAQPTPALAFAGPSAGDKASHTPAGAALEAALRPSLAPIAPKSTPDASKPVLEGSKPSGLAGKLDANLRRLATTLEAANRTAEGAAKSLSPYGELVISPFKPLTQASR